MLTKAEKKLRRDELRKLDRIDLIWKVMSEDYAGTPEEVVQKCILNYPEKRLPKYSRE